MCEFFPFSIDLLNLNVGCTKSSLMVLITNVFATYISYYQDTGKKGKKKTCVLIGATNGVNSSSLASAPCLQ